MFMHETGKTHVYQEWDISKINAFIKIQKGFNKKVFKIGNYLYPMKISLLFAIVGFSITACSQNNRQVINDQFSRLTGNWEGFMEYTDMYDNKIKYSMPAECQTLYNGKKWQYAVQYDEGEGEKSGGKGDCTVNDDGTRMNYDGVVWNVVNVTQKGDSINIVLETTGKENRKKANLRRTIFSTSETFSILEEVNFVEEGPNYILRNKHVFRRKK